MAALPGVSRLILVAGEKYPRYSEGDVIGLTDGRLLLAVGRKEGSSDFARGTLIGIFSRDGGVSWDDQPHVIQAPFDDVGDVMSVSLCRSPRGVHLFFLGRGPDAKADTRIYQMISEDEGRSWGKPIRVSERAGYHVVNNARVIRTSKGRLIVPSAHLPGPWKQIDAMGVYVLHSDDDGKSWQQSNDLSLGEKKPLMEPGVAECADGSLYMTIRTREGFLYEARSRDGGATWVDFVQTALTAPSAPSTVYRDPHSENLWMFWINRAVGTGGGTWKQRTPLCFAVSRDRGRTWSPPRDVENDPRHSYGYYSITPMDRSILMTYYDWTDNGQAGFQMTSLRQRTIPVEWFDEKPAPPVFRTHSKPVLKQDGAVVSCNSGLLIEEDRWRLWYTVGELGPAGEKLRVHTAESKDQGLTWKPLGPASIEGVTDAASAYHPSVHRTGGVIVMYLWRRDDSGSGLYRAVSHDGGKTFAIDPETPLMVWPLSSDAQKKLAGDGCVSNDAFDVLWNDRGSWEYFAACLEKATDERTIIKHDNAAGLLRLIGRAASSDGIGFSPPEIIIRPEYDAGDPYDLQFYGMQVFQYRKFYLGLLHTYHVESQVIQPEWAWSHDGQSWARTGTPCISLGDEGGFDSRMIVFGGVTIVNDELVWLYGGSDWRHNAFKAGKVQSAIGRASLPRAELDAWLDSLPQP